MDEDYVFVDFIPLLCNACCLPLTLSMDSVSLVTDAPGGMAALSIQSLVHAETHDPSSITSSAYESALNHFRLHLDTEEYNRVVRGATFTDVVTALVACKNAQANQSTLKQRGNQHLDRLLQRIHHYKGVVDIAVQNSTQLVSLVWASMVFLIQVTSSFTTIQGKLACMLSEIADSVGRVELFKTLYPTQHMLCVVANLYSEIVDVLRSMIDFWKRYRLDRRILHAFWNPFEIQYQSAMERIKYLVDLTDRTATASHMVAMKTQNSVIEILVAVQGIQARLDEQQADTALARKYSQKLRRYLLSASAQKDEDGFLEFQLARQTYGTCDFILGTEQYETWAHSRSSILLGVVGGPGSGKSIISAFLYDRARISASENSPVIWLHCMPVLRATRIHLLRALIWKILEQRPDILLKNIHDKKHYIQLFRDAATFEQLWSILIQVVSCLSEIWIIIDSIHDCDGRLALISELKMLIQRLNSRTRIKVAVSSRHVVDFPVAHKVLQYTADDMQSGIVTYVRHEIQQRGWSDHSENYDELVRVASKTISAVGGGLFWARAVVHVAVAQLSEKEAILVLARIESPQSVIGILWKDIYCRPGESQALIRSIAELLVSVPGSPVTIRDLHRMLTHDKPEAPHGVDLDSVKTVVQTQLCGLVNRVNGRYGIPNEIRKHLRPYLEAARPNEMTEETAHDRKANGGDVTLESAATSNSKKNKDGVYVLLIVSMFIYIVYLNMNRLLPER